MRHSEERDGAGGKPGASGRRGLSKPVRDPARDEARECVDVEGWNSSTWEERGQTARRVPGCNGACSPPESDLGRATQGDSDCCPAPIRKHCVLLRCCGSCTLAVGGSAARPCHGWGWQGRRRMGIVLWMADGRCESRDAAQNMTCTFAEPQRRKPQQTPVRREFDAASGPEAYAPLGAGKAPLRGAQPPQCPHAHSFSAVSLCHILLSHLAPTRGRSMLTEG